MCECGCTFGNPVYRLPINKDTCYTIDLFRGCKDCSAGTGVVIRKVDRSSPWWKEIEDAPLFPLTEIDMFQEGAIKCGLDPSEFRKAVAAELPLVLVGDDNNTSLNSDDKEEIANMIWEEILQKRPQIVEYQPRKTL